MAYTAWSVVYGEQPTAAKWNQLGTNDAGFKDGTNIDTGAIIARHLAAASVVAASLGVNAAMQNDGWISTADVWNYASASSFTVSGDQTAKYPAGTRLKFVQTTTKYAVVISSSYGAPNTTVNIAVNTDYTIANAAISSNVYSYADNPQGYPMLFNYTPATTNITLGNGTLSGVFSITGKTVFARAKFVLGSTSAMGTGPTIGLPVAPYGYANFAPIGIAGMRDDSSGAIYFGAFIYDGEPLVFNAAGTYVVYSLLTATVPLPWTTSDSCWFTASYTIQ